MSDSEKPKIWVSALLCSDVIRDVDGPTTAIKISNGFQATQDSIVLPDGKVMGFWRPLAFKVIITSHSVEERVFNMTFMLIKPDGSTYSGLPRYDGMHVKGALGMTLTVDMILPSENDGVFWLDIFADGELVFKLPMVVTHQRREELLQRMVAELKQPVKGDLAEGVVLPK